MQRPRHKQQQQIGGKQPWPVGGAKQGEGGPDLVAAGRAKGDQRHAGVARTTAARAALKDGHHVAAKAGGSPAFYVKMEKSREMSENR